MNNETRRFAVFAWEDESHGGWDDLRGIEDNLFAAERVVRKMFEAHRALPERKFMGRSLRGDLKAQIVDLQPGYERVVWDSEESEAWAFRLEVRVPGESEWKVFATVPPRINDRLEATIWIAQHTPVGHFNDRTESRIVSLRDPLDMTYTVYVGPAYKWQTQPCEPAQ